MNHSESRSAMKKPAEKKPVIARMEPALQRALDAAARKAGRSRSAELCMRLRHSLKAHPVVPAVEGA